jgi:hypothetical protein
MKTMGLDMDLIKRYYIGAEYEHNKITGVCDIFSNGERLDIDFRHIQYIETGCIYWRKANMIHKWFVDHCQDGEDDCKPYYVSSKQLCELLNACLIVKSNPELAREILPTQEGFFFGGTDYDEDYFSDIEDTIKKLSMLNLMGEDYSFDYYYQSSW